jgi:tetratricopeptide (TPR) repeat protein
MAFLDKLFALFKVPGAGLLRRGHAHLKKKEYGQAIVAFTEALRVVKADPRLVASTLSNRSVAYQHRGDYDAVIADCTEAIRLRPDLAAAYVNRAAAYHHKGEEDRAIADCGEALRLDPKMRVSVLATRAPAHHTKGEFDAAIADWTDLIRLKPKLATAYVNRGAVYEHQGDHARALADFEEVVRLQPGLAIGYVNRGLVHLRLGDPAKAAADFTEAIRLDPKCALAYNNQAWLWATSPRAELRDGSRAVEYATKACELAEWKKAACLGTLAAAYAEVGRFDEALKWQQKALATPGYPLEQVEKGKLRLQLYAEGKPWREEMKS